MVLEGSEAAKHFLKELEQVLSGGSHSSAESSRDHSQRIGGQTISDSDEEVDTDEEGDRKELFNSVALAAILKAVTNTSSDSGSITITSPGGSKIFFLLTVLLDWNLRTGLRNLLPSLTKPVRSFYPF